MRTQLALYRWRVAVHLTTASSQPWTSENLSSASALRGSPATTKKQGSRRLLRSNSLEVASRCDLDRTSNTLSRTPKPTFPMIVFAPTLCGKDGSDTTERNTAQCCTKLLNRLCFAFQSVRNPFF